MDVFTDIHSGLQFCIGTDDSNYSTITNTGISDYNLIKWCEDFLTSEGTFIDIGSDMGTYSVILSKKCKEVYAFESDKTTFDRLNIGLCINNCFNVKANRITLHSESNEQGNIRTLDSYEIKNVDLMRIVVENELEVIKGANMTLITNNFPPFIIEVNNDEWYRNNPECSVDVLSYIKELGYKIRPISGRENSYLACDHELRNIKENTYIPHSGIRLQAKVTSEVSSDIITLSQRYEANPKELYQDTTITWDIWHSLAMYYRKMPSSQAQAYDCAMKGLSLSPPIDKEDLLYEEIAIVAYYVNKKSEGYQACEHVILSPYVSWSTRNYTLNNQAFYMKRLPFKKIIEIKCDLPEGQIESTSSLIKTLDGSYRLNLMTVNYSIDNKGSYEITDRKQIVKNKSFLLTLDKTLTTSEVSKTPVELQDVSGVELYQQNIRGFENIRLFGDNEMFCTYRAINPNHTHQICYCRYDPNTGNVTKITPLIIGNELVDESDWLPFVQNGEIYFVYKFSPVRIYKLDRETGQTSLIKEISLSNKNLEIFLGSGGLIEYKDGWLGTCHQAYYHDNQAVKDFHRLIWFDKEFTTMKYTEAFYFESPDIEFNLSICHSDEGLLIPYSQRDNNSKIGILNYEIIDSWLGI